MCFATAVHETIDLELIAFGGNEAGKFYAQSLARYS